MTKTKISFYNKKLHHTKATREFWKEKKVDREFCDKDREFEGRKAEKAVLTDDERKNILK